MSKDFHPVRRREVIVVSFDDKAIAKMLALKESMEDALEALRAALEIIHTNASVSFEELAALFDVLTAKEPQEVKPKAKTHPCPYNPPRRPVKAVRAVKQFYPHPKKRPQARSAIRRRGNRRRT